VNIDKKVRQHKERTRSRLGHCGKSAFELLGILDFIELELHAEHPSCCLRFPQIGGSKRANWVEEDRHAGDPGDSLFEQLQMFPHDLQTGNHCHPRDVAPWLCEAGDKAFLNRVEDIHHDDGDRAGGFFGCTGSCVTHGNEEVNLETHKLGREVWGSLGLPPVHPYSITKPWPSTYPRSRIPSLNGPKRRSNSGVLGGTAPRAPIR
jgi:hypothetical protein